MSEETQVNVNLPVNESQTISIDMVDDNIESDQMVGLEEFKLAAGHYVISVSAKN